MKKSYEKADISVVLFSEDIITASGDNPVKSIMNFTIGNDPDLDFNEIFK